MSQVIDHVRELAEVIGPRPACTDAEARAADYIEEVFRSRGLEPERQEFDCPRTYSWAYALYHALTIGAAVLSIWLPWPALALAVVAAVMLWADLDTRFTLARYLGKGPSQNVIARHVPRQRRGERLKRIVIVAHYDSTKPALTFSPGLVRNLPLLTSITKWTTFLTPVVILFGAMPFAVEWRPWTGYAAVAVAAYLLFPLFAMVQRELLSHANDGANDNASGVAAMLGVMEATVPEPDEVQFRDRPYRRDAEAAIEAGVVPEEALLEYRPMGGEMGRPAQDVPLDGFGDVDWETGTLEPVRQPEPAPEVRKSQPPTSDDWTEGSGGLWEESEPVTPARPQVDLPPSRPAPPRPAPAPVPANWGARPAMPLDEEDELAEGQESLPFDLPEARPSAETRGEKRAEEPADEPAEDQHGHGISAWLGIGKGFDVRKAGKKIGSWDNLDDEDDEFGFKGGTAGEEPLDPETVDAAARIRRRVTESVDRALAEKEIWFVATGADEAGGWGMRALLDAYGDELDDALIINIDSVGTGTVSFVTEEGMARAYHSDRRLVAQAKRTVRENGLSAKSVSYRGFVTSATPALARRYKAMSVMAFDINGRVPNWHWHTDVAENISPRSLEQATEFLTALLRDL